MTQEITKQGSGYYTEDAEYIVVLASNPLDDDERRYEIHRGDGSFSTQEWSEDEAHEVARALAAGDRDDAELEWLDA